MYVVFNLAYHSCSRIYFTITHPQPKKKNSSVTTPGLEMAHSALASYFLKFGREPATPSQLVHFNKNTLRLGNLRCV